MNAISIRIDDETMVSGLARLAPARQRSVEAEAMEIIRAALAENPRPDRRSIADRIAAMTLKGVVQTDSVQIIREMREERDRVLMDGVSR